MNTIKHLLSTSILATFFINFRYFPLSQAIKLPISVSRHIKIVSAKGKLYINAPIRKGMIQLGYCGLGTQDTKYDRTLWQINGVIVFKGPANIGRGTSLSVGGFLTFGDNFKVTGSSTIICNRQMIFGDNVLISWDCLVMDTDFHKILDHNEKRVNEDCLVKVGNGVWIGCRSTILKGSLIPDGSVIAASSVITRRLSLENCIYGGAEGGKVLKENISWRY